MKNRFLTVRSKLNDFINRYYTINTLRGGVLFLGLATFLLVTAALTVYFTDASVALRTILVSVLLILLVATFSFWIAVPLLKRKSLIARMSHMDAAKRIVDIDKTLGEKLINGLELESFQSDNDLIGASLDQITDELKVFQGTGLITYKRVKQVTWTLIPFAFAIILVVVSGNVDSLLSGTDRLVSFRSEYLPKDFVSFQLESSPSINEGEDYKVVIRVSSQELPTAVKVQINGVEVSAAEQERGVYASVVRSVYDDFSVVCIAGRYVSNEWDIEVIKKARILNSFFYIKPPAYTQLEPSKVRGSNSIVVPENSTLAWTGQVINTSMVNAWSDTTKRNLIKEGDGLYSLSERIKENQKWQVKDNGSEIASYKIDIVKDRYPSIRATMVRDTTSLNGYYISGSIDDDYGFKSLVLVKKNTETGSTKKEALDISKAKQQSFYHYAEFLEKAQVYIEVRDNDPFNGYKRSKSTTFSVEKTNKEDFKQEVGESKAKSKQKIEERIREIKEKEKTKELKGDKVQSKDEKQGFEDIKKLSDEFRKQLELEKENDLYDEEIMEKQEMLEERFKELDRDLQELLKELDRLEKEVTKDQRLDEDVEILKEDVLDELERMMNMLDRLQFEKDLDDAIKKLDELEKQQKELAESKEERSEDQKRLKDEFKKLDEELKDLKEDSKELQMGDLEDINDEDSEKVEEEMENAQEDLEKRSDNKANEHQENAAEGLKKMKDKLQKAQSDMNAEEQSENAEDLRMLLDNLLVLSSSEEDLQTELNGMQSTNPDYIDKMNSQGQFSRDYKIIEDSLNALMVRAPEIEMQVLKEMNTIDRYFKKSSESLKDNKVKEGVSEIRYLMTSVNNLALMLNSSLENMQSMMSKPKSGDKSCDKPGSGKPGMSELKKRQQQLSKQAKEMQKEFGGAKPGEGKKPGQSKGQGKSKGQQIGEMLGEQEMIRKGLKQLEKDGGKGSGNGDLDDLLRKNEEDLANRNFDTEFFERQKEIESKMLESERALLEREQDNKRESETNKDEYNRTKSAAEKEYILKKQSDIEQINFDRIFLSPFYEGKIINEPQY